MMDQYQECHSLMEKSSCQCDWVFQHNAYAIGGKGGGKQQHFTLDRGCDACDEATYQCNEMKRQQLRKEKHPNLE